MAPESLYLSQFVGARVSDATGARVGWVADAVVTRGDPFPALAALVVRRQGQQSLHVPWRQVREVADRLVVLSSPIAQVENRPMGDGDILLAAEVLDKQLVDTQGRRVVKVNDLKLIGVRDELRVVGVDVGMRGILRRLRVEAATERVARMVRQTVPDALIPWRFVESIPGRGGDVRLSVPFSRLERLHPADLGRIISQLPAEDRTVVVESFSDERVAETLGGMDPPAQVSILDGMDSERAADILERMAPDEAADLLQHLPEERQSELLTLVTGSDAEQLSELLRYDERAAGGLMTTEFIAVAHSLTAQEALRHVREAAPDAETVYYLYVVDDEGRLMGVLSLLNLLTSPPDRPVSESMSASVVSVTASMDQEQVAAVIAKYRLLAVPVVDEEDHLLGIVTVDDTIDVVDEEAEEDLSHIAGTTATGQETLHHRGWAVVNRAPWLLLALTAGVFGAGVLHYLPQPMLARAALFLPLLFLVGSQVAAQAAATTARGIALRDIDRSNWWAHCLAELGASAPVALGAGLVGALFAGLLLGPVWALVVGLSAASIALSGSVVGLTIPLAETALRMDPATALRPIVVSLMAVVVSAIYTLLLWVFLV